MRLPTRTEQRRAAFLGRGRRKPLPSNGQQGPGRSASALISMAGSLISPSHLASVFDEVAGQAGARRWWDVAARSSPLAH
jgi:hypothetical protein